MPVRRSKHIAPLADDGSDDLMIPSDELSRESLLSENPGPSRACYRQNSHDLSQNLDAESNSSLDEMNDPVLSKQPRLRKRLSTRKSEGGVDISRSSANMNDSSPDLPMTKEVLLQTYKSTIDMFFGQKICPENSFSLKFLEVVRQFFKSSIVDTHDMPAVAVTLEVATKIYVARVEQTYTEVKKIGLDILQKTRDNSSNQNRPATEDKDSENLDIELEESQHQRKKTHKKLKSFIVDDSKLTMDFQKEGTNFASRRMILKDKLLKMSNSGGSFDYLSFFPGLDTGRDQSGAWTEDEKRKLGTEARIVNAADMDAAAIQVPFMKFRKMIDWDPDKYTIWGEPMKPSEDCDMWEEVIPLNVDPEFAYDPEGRPKTYDEDEQEESHVCFDEVPLNNTVARPLCEDEIISISQMRTIEDFSEYCYKVLSLARASGSPWCGAIFMKPKSTPKYFGKSVKAPKKNKKKSNVPIKASDLSEKMHLQYCAPETLVYDERTIEKWSLDHYQPVPYLGIEDCESEEMDELDYDFHRRQFPDNIFSKSYVMPLTRYFIYPDFIVQLKANGQLNLPNGSNESQLENPAELIPADDYVSQLEVGRENLNDESTIEGHNEDQFQRAESDQLMPLNSSAFNAIMSSLGITDDDPMNKASEADSVKFSRIPKPINMSRLKASMGAVLKKLFQIDGHFQSTENFDQKVDFATFAAHLFSSVDKKIAKHLTVSIIVVALMHVLVEKRIFMEENPESSSNPLIVVHGRNWVHSDHIPSGSITLNKQKKQK